MRMLPFLAIFPLIACAIPASAMPAQPSGTPKAASHSPTVEGVDEGGSPGRGRSGASLGTTLESGSLIEAGERLKPGEYIWTPEVAPSGPLLIVVSLADQKAMVYRDGLPIGISTVSSGRSGYPTPTGTFTVLQRAAVHHSNLYDNAPMPHMLRLTWDGIALHGGDVPRYPASHGCIRLPRKFARLLFGLARIGTTVIVTDEADLPQEAPEGAAGRHPGRSRSGPAIAIGAAQPGP